MPDQPLILLNQVAAFSQQYSAILDAGFLVFVRLLAFSMSAPVLSRKDFPFVFRLNLVLLITCFLFTAYHGMSSVVGKVSSANVLMYFLQVGFNVGVGVLIGFVGSMIMDTLTSAGSLVNNQIGLSSAVIFDPSSRQQITILDKLYGLIAVVMFMHLKGLHWMLAGIIKTFHLFPVTLGPQNIFKLISMEYMVRVSAQVLEIGLLLVAPVFIVTIAVDIILGVVNRIAPQIQVFQLSFSLKPVIGIAIVWVTLPKFLDVAQQFLLDSYKVF